MGDIITKFHIFTREKYKIAIVVKKNGVRDGGCQWKGVRGGY